MRDRQVVARVRLRQLLCCECRITYCHLPFQSKWMYVGTDHGNVHVMNIEAFSLSGYTIMWNKAIEL